MPAVTRTPPATQAPGVPPMLAVYRRLLSSPDPLPGHLLRRMVTELGGGRATETTALLTARPELSDADAAALVTDQPLIAAAYLSRADVTPATATIAAPPLTTGLAAEAARPAVARAAHVALLRHHAGRPDVLVALAGNDAVDLATRHASLTALDRAGHNDSVRAHARLLPADVRARALPGVTARWLLADLLDQPLPDDDALTGARRLLQMTTTGAGRDAQSAAATAAALRRIAAYLAPEHATDLSREVATADAKFTPVDRVKTMLTLTAAGTGADLPTRLGPLPWTTLLEATTDDTVWDAAGRELTAVLTDADTAAVLAAVMATLDAPSVGDVLTTVAGITSS